MTGTQAALTWEQVAGTRPRLRPELESARHVYRGRAWQVMHDPLSGRSHRMPASAYGLAERLDGGRTVAQAHAQALDAGGDDAPSRAEALDIVTRLAAAGLLDDATPGAAAPRGLGRALANPFAIRIPLLDPDRLLQALVPLARPLFSGTGAACWLLLVVCGLVATIVSWSELVAHWQAQTLAPRTVAMVAVAYVLMKTLHELGHGLATRVWGGAVHEVGVQLLVLFPLPYVDASSSIVFPDRRRRLVVPAAGIAVELALAAAAVLVWTQAGAGALRDLMLNVAVIGSLSTLVFNGNPLLRFDGYHVLVELVEIPSLGTRAARYWRYLAERSLFGLATARSPASAPGETPWLAGYGLLAGIYRWVVAIGIIWYVAGAFPAIGAGLALWAAATLIGVPVLRLVRYLGSNPALSAHRGRAVGATLALLATFGIAAFALPVPFASRVEGVVWPPDGARVRAESQGFVAEVLAAAGQPVNRGDALMVLEAPLLEAELGVLEARQAELEAELAVEAFADRARAATLRDALAALEAETQAARARLARLVVRSPADGIFVPLVARNPLGRLVRQGDAIGLIADDGRTLVRTAVDEDVAGLIREHGGTVSARFAGAVGRVVEAQIEEETPAARGELPSIVLGTAGGGQIPVDRTNSSGVRTLAPVFQLLLEIPVAPQRPALGQRVHLRFDHGSAPLASQWWRATRQAFLARLGI